jgi:hypothetical protein
MKSGLSSLLTKATDVEDNDDFKEKKSAHLLSLKDRSKSDEDDNTSRESLLISVNVPSSSSLSSQPSPVKPQMPSVTLFDSVSLFNIHSFMFFFLNFLVLHCS